VQCAEDAPGQNVTPDLYHLEVVDPETGRRLPDGENGMLAITASGVDRALDDAAPATPSQPLLRAVE